MAMFSITSGNASSGNIGGCCWSCCGSPGFHDVGPLRLSAYCTELERNHAASQEEEGGRSSSRIIHLEKADTGEGVQTQ